MTYKNILKIIGGRFDSMKNMTKKRKSYDLEEAIEYFTSASGPIKVRGNVEYSLALSKLEEVSKERGLNPEDITALIDVAASGKQNDTVSVKLIRSLIPSSVVPERAVIIAISHMCTNKPSTSVQSLLLRWILLVYDYIPADQRNNLHKLYGLIFYFLENQVLLPDVCHLLYLLTRREDVKMFRVRLLMNLQSRIGPQPYLIGLLSIYKLYYPNMVSVVLPKTKRLFFRMRDQTLSATIKRVQKLNAPQHSLIDTTLASERLKMAESTQIRGTETKRRKIDPIPKVHSNSTTVASMPNDSFIKKLESSKRAFVEINDLKVLMDKPEIVEFPSQMGAVLQCPLLQHFMSFNSDAVTTSRFSYWLNDTLSDEMLDSSVTESDVPRITELLNKLIQFTEFIQEGIPVVSQFLFWILHRWNGRDFRPQIFRLVTRCRLYSFTELNDNVLEPIRKLYLCSCVYFKCQVILCLTQLLRNYIVYEYQRHKEFTKLQPKSDKGGDSQREMPSHALFTDDVENVESHDTIIQLIKYIHRICVLGLQLEQSHPLLLHCTLQFLELISDMHQGYGMPFVILPSKEIFLRPFFSDNAMGPARVCRILINYKNNLEAVKKSSSGVDLESLNFSPKETTQCCNSVITDIANALWRNRPFSHSKSSSCYNFKPSDYDSSLFDVDDRLSVYMHQAFLGFTLMFLNETQPKENIGHPKGVKPVRDVFMKFLEREHIFGITDFVSTFICRGGSSTAWSRSQISEAS